MFTLLIGIPSRRASAQWGVSVARRGVEEASDSAGDRRVRGGAGGGVTGKVALYFPIHVDGMGEASKYYPQDTGTRPNSVKCENC